MLDNILNSHSILDFVCIVETRLNSYADDREKRAFIKDLDYMLGQRYSTVMFNMRMNAGANTQFHILSGNDAVIVYTREHWSIKNSHWRYWICNLLDFIQKSKKDMAPTKGVRIDEKAISGIIDSINQRYRYLSLLALKEPLLILLIDDYWKPYNAFIAAGYNQYDEIFCRIVIPYMLYEDGKGDSPEAVLIHELGHVLHNSVTGRINGIPEPFDTLTFMMHQKILGKEMAQKLRGEHVAELFAIAFTKIAADDLNYSSENSEDVHGVFKRCKQFLRITLQILLQNACE